jgi:hypothetical protein
MEPNQDTLRQILSGDSTAHNAIDSLIEEEGPTHDEKWISLKIERDMGKSYEEMSPGEVEEYGGRFNEEKTYQMINGWPFWDEIDAFPEFRKGGEYYEPWMENRGKFSPSDSLSQPIDLENFLKPQGYKNGT